MHFLQHSLALSSAWAAVFWICASLIGYTYVGYPVLLRIVTAFRKQRLLPPSSAPSLTLLIAAHNEGQQLERKLHESLALHYPRQKLQILVVSDGSTDSTEAIVRSFAAKGVELVAIPRQGGKTNAQNIALRHAKGEIVVFSDATTQYHPDALRFLAGAFADDRVGAVSGRYSYFDLDNSSPTSEGAQAYAGYDNWVRQMQSAACSITGCCGCIYAVRRRLYTALEPHIISDLVEPLHVLLQGRTVKFEPRAVAREDVTCGSGNEFRMRVRVTARALTGLASVKQLLIPWKHPWITLQIVSHKLLRYAMPWFLLGLLMSSLALHGTDFYLAMAAAQLLLGGLALAGALSPVLRKYRMFSLPMYFCVVNAAVGWGAVKFLSGERYIIWRPQREASHAG